MVHYYWRGKGQKCCYHHDQCPKRSRSSWWAVGLKCGIEEAGGEEVMIPYDTVKGTLPAVAPLTHLGNLSIVQNKQTPTFKKKVLKNNLPASRSPTVRISVLLHPILFTSPSHFPSSYPSISYFFSFTPSDTKPYHTHVQPTNSENGEQKSSPSLWLMLQQKAERRRGRKKANIINPLQRQQQITRKPSLSSTNVGTDVSP